MLKKLQSVQMSPEYMTTHALSVNISKYTNFRRSFEEIPRLSCTDMECGWKDVKRKVEKKYEATPLHLTKCFQNSMQRNSHIEVNNEERESLFREACAAVPESEFSLHL